MSVFLENYLPTISTWLTFAMTTQIAQTLKDHTIVAVCWVIQEMELLAKVTNHISFIQLYFQPGTGTENVN